MFKNLAAAVMLLMLLCGQVFAETRIGTWNLEHLSDRPNKDFKAIAKVAKNVDFLAVQELMSEAALDKLARELSRQSGEPWSHMASDAVGRSSYKEMYGFVWKDSKVAYEDGAVSYLDRKKIFEREPYSARFKSLTDNAYFVVATVHIVYGKKPSDRVAEIDALSSYWTWLKEVYPGNNHILLMGDFNMPPTSPAWKSLNAAARPLVVAGASTLSTTDGKFANLYDNIFVSHSSPLKVNSVGVYDYPKHLGMTHQQGRANISDHAPIFLRAELGQGKGTATTAASPARPAAAAKTKAATVADATGQVRGNRAKKRYHRPDCPSYNSIAEKNRIEFSSESAAQAEGYSIAGNCQKAG